MSLAAARSTIRHTPSICSLVATMPGSDVRDAVRSSRWLSSSRW
jgi:hypothetical protein